MHLYLLPGLGFDHRIYRNLALDNYKHTFYDWIDPEPGESIQNYAARLSTGMTTTEPVVLIGHSFGGMVAQEIAAIRKVDLIILVSSARSSEEIPYHFKLAHKFNLQRFFSRELTLKSFKFWGSTFDYTTPEEQALFKSMVGNQSNQFLKWALKTLGAWKTPNISKSCKVIQIHGDRDRTLPLITKGQPDQLVKGAGHFMIYKKADEIMTYINEVIEKIVALEKNKS